MYRILTLDGGGCWAVLQAMALQELFTPETRGHEVLASFDLVAANSGGSLTLGGLLENMSLAELNALFMREAARRQVFAQPGLLEHLEYAVLRELGIGWKYSTEGKLQGLRALLPRCGDMKLAGLPERIAPGGQLPEILICGFDFDQAHGVLFRSNPDSRAASPAPSGDPTLAEAINASSDAPVAYFDAPARFGRRQFWDGGVAGYNNPVLVAVIEAMANGEQGIHALSIGTGTVSLPFDHGGSQDGLVRGPQDSAPIADLRRLAEAIVDDPPDVASFHAHVAVGGKLPAASAQAPTPSPIVRLNPLIQPVKANGAAAWQAPDGYTLEAFKALQDVPIDAVDGARFDLVVQLGRAWIANKALNQPVRMNRDTLACEIGYRTFTEAAKAYLDWARKGPASRVAARTG